MIMAQENAWLKAKEGLQKTEETIHQAHSPLSEPLSNTKDCLYAPESGESGIKRFRTGNWFPRQDVAMVPTLRVE
jgi:hypothetical protein